MCRCLVVRINADVVTVSGVLARPVGGTGATIAARV
jgi:glutamate synthase domain-containing protein 2